jgi:vacuolar protein-sorting-associated protein 4
MARESKPSIIFIDEIDALCSTRSDGENDSTRRIKTEFLVQMQGMSNESRGVLILGATNVPYNLDPAIRRRFDKRVYISLPEDFARSTMFKIHIGNTPHSLNEEDFVELGKMTEGYSGSDISNLVQTALMEPVRACQDATHFKKVRGALPHDPDEIVDDLYTPCDPRDKNAIEMTLLDVPGEKLNPPIMTKADFIKALKTTRPTVSKSDLKIFENFTEEFGQEG